MPIELLAELLGVVITIVGAYFAAQALIKVAVARLETQYAALAARVEKTEGHGKEISDLRSDIAVLHSEVQHAEAHGQDIATARSERAVIRSQVEDARAEIKELRTGKHEIGNLRVKIDAVISLFRRYISLDQSLIDKDNPYDKS